MEEKKKEVKMGLTEEDIRGANRGFPLAGLLKSMGDDDADADAIAESEDGRIMAERMSVMAMPEDSEESKAYWAGYEKGLEKEVHGEGLEKWASYIPLAAKKDPGRRFPLIFCLHGAHNPVQLTESYGIIQLAAREECVVIAPENENWDSIERLYLYAKEHYPVDLSRVYSMGYSFGGFMTSRNGLAHPEIFAGLGMGGMLFAQDVKAHDLDGQWYEEYRLTDSMIERVRELGLSAALVLGENEMLRLLPLWKEPEGEVRDGVIPLTGADKKKSFENLRRAFGCAPARYLAQGEEGTAVEKAIGVRFEREETREYNGRRYFIGDSLNGAGECLFRTIACEKMVHWPASMYAELMWEQIGKYARDPETGKLVRI